MNNQVAKPPVNDFRQDNFLVEASQLYRNRAVESYRSLFFENIGQLENSNVVFYGMTDEGMIGFGEGTVTLQNCKSGHVVSYPIPGFNCSVPYGAGESISSTSLFLGGRGAFTGIRSFLQVEYTNDWSDVNLVFSLTRKGLRYKLWSDGLSSQIENDVVFQVQFASFARNILAQPVNQNIQEIQSEEIQTTSESTDHLVNPILFSSYVGGSSYDYGRSIALDLEGNIYVAGATESNDFPTVNAFDDIKDGLHYYPDCFVFKMNSTGSLVYSTFIGGDRSDHVEDMVVDTTGSVYLTGHAGSQSFPLVNAYDDSFPGGDGTAFLLKLSSNGSAIVFSTFIDGCGTSSIDLDGNGDIYLAGLGGYGSFPLVNPYDNTLGGEGDCVVMKFDRTGNDIIYSTLVGGSDRETWPALAVDESGNAFVTGSTESLDFPTVNAYQPAHSVVSDAFVFKLNATGNGLVYSTYIGGRGYDDSQDIAVDKTGIAIVVGITSSENFPIVNAIDSTLGGYTDCFILRLDSSGNELLSSTLFGGSEGEDVYGLHVDGEGSIFVTGTTRSTDFPSTYEVTSGGGCVVFKLNPSASSVLYSTCFGGTGLDDDVAFSVVVDSSGTAALTGTTRSLDFPTEAALDDTLDGYTDCFVFKMLDITDSDSDSLTDIEESIIGTNPLLVDSDNDTMPDAWEYKHNLNPLVPDATLDFDEDGLLNIEEYNLGTRPDRSDSDADFMPDFWEVNNSLNPIVPDAIADPDKDDLNNLRELRNECNPQNNDSDFDSMPDGWEVNWLIDPLYDDSNEDPDHDELPNLGEYQHGTNPHSNDTDMDSYLDGWEVANGLSPLVRNSAFAGWDSLLIGIGIGLILVAVANQFAIIAGKKLSKNSQNPSRVSTEVKEL
jgi:hypothetical protein